MTTSFPRALYLEFRKSDVATKAAYAYQYIIIPDAANPIDGSAVPLTLWARQISPENPKRSWKRRSVVEDASKATAITASTDIQEALTTTEANITGLSMFMSAMTEADWNPYGHPLVVEATADDLVNVNKGESPAALIRRLGRARESAGFTEDVWDTFPAQKDTIVTPLFSADATAAREQMAAAAKDNEVYKKFYDMSVSEDIKNAIVSTVLQGAFPSVIENLTPYLNEEGKAKGRSVAAKKPIFTEEADSEYVRPNGEKYFPRKWGEHEADVLVLRRARERNHYTLLFGPPGTGKTALAEAAFENLHTILGSGDTEVADFIGSYVMTQDGGFEWVDGPLIKAAEAGEPLLIDEIGLVDPKVLSMAYGLMDGRRELVITANPKRGTVKAAPGFYVVAATNPHAPGVRLSEALLSRFTIHVEVKTDWQLARKQGVPTKLVTAAQNLSKKQENGETRWAPQFRELLAFRDLSRDFGEAFALSNLIASAPEIDRPVVAEVLIKVFGVAISPATI